MKLSKTTANLTTLTPAQRNNHIAKGIKPEHRFLIIVIWALLLALLISVFVFRFAVVSGDSMKGTLDNGDLIVVSLNSYKSETPQRNDVVLFERADLTKGRIVKRVVAVAGDEIEIRDGKLFVNGEVCNESFFGFGKNEQFAPLTVPDGCCFVIGDNFAESNDSRHWNEPFVKYEDIDGKVVCRLFPKISSIY